MKFKFRNLLIPLVALSLAACGNTPSEPVEPVEPKEPTIDDYYQEAIKDYTPLAKRDIDSFDRTYTKVTSTGAYVRKVNNIDDQSFIMGVDASSVIVEENSGVKYYDFNGNEADVFKVLSDSGVNYIRVRVWNNPFDSEGHGYGGGNNDLATAIAIGQRATQYNMSLLVDFHYSDFWADPSKQMSPKAWEGMSVTDRTNALYEYTKESLQALKDANVVVGMVQIGNETNSGNMAGSVGFNNFVKLANAGSKAVREVFPNALVALHFANPEKWSNYLDWASRVKTVDYDVFGSSYYPYWHGTLDNLSKVLSTIAATYNKRVMVLETSYCYTSENTDFNNNTIGETSGYDVKNYPFTVHGQINSMVDIIDTIVNHTVNGIGVCYWEGTWISVGTNSWEENHELWERYGSGWASSYSVAYDPKDAGQYYGGCAVENQALFDETGHPLESLKLFNLVRFGNEIENKVDGVQDVELIKYDNEDFSLPSTVNAVYYDNSVREIPVTWESFDIAAAKARGNAKYEIQGTAGGYKVLCKLTIMEYNYVDNYSFETGNYGSKWKMTTNDTLSSTHIIKVTNENPQTGRYAAHFWTSDAGGVNFDLKQDISGLSNGKYKLQMSMLGGGSGSDALPAAGQNVYIYVAINGTIIKQVSHTITKWSDGYKDVVLKGVEYTGGTLTIGVHVEISTAGCWGDIDDVMFNSDK